MGEPPGRAERRDAGGTTEGEEEDRWAQLPPELLPVVYKKLPDSADFVRFRTVCRAWRDAAPVDDPPSQLPWVVQRRGSAFQAARAHFRFYSPSSGRTYSVRGYGGRSWLVVAGACQEYLVTTVDLSTTALYNPLTGDRLALPPAPYPQWRHGVVHVVADAGNWLVVNTSTRTRHFGYCRPGDTKWSLVDGRQDMGHRAYHRGRFYVNTSAQETLVIDASTGAVESVLPPPPPPPPRSAGGGVSCGDYLVESRGKLIRAVLFPRDGVVAASPEDYHLNVYQLDEAPHDGKAAAAAMWAKVDSVGDRVLFFDRHGHGFSLEGNGAAELRRDCVYFMHEKRTWVDAGEHRFLCRYSMEDREVDRVVSLADTFGDTWVVPGLCPSE